MSKKKAIKLKRDDFSKDGESFDGNTLVFKHESDPKIQVFERFCRGYGYIYWGSYDGEWLSQQHSFEDCFEDYIKGIFKKLKR